MSPHLSHYDLLFEGVDSLHHLLGGRDGPEDQIRFVRTGWYPSQSNIQIQHKLPQFAVTDG